MNGNEENESFYRDANEDTESEYQLEDPMTFWNAEKKTLWRKILGRTETPFVLMGVGLMLVVALFFAFFPRGEGGEALPDSEALSERFQQIEDKIGRMETTLEGLSVLQEDMEPVKKAVLRFDNADASMSARVQRLAEEMASLQKEMESLKKTLTAEAKASTPTPRAEKPASASQAAYHEVVKGDTLYSIGRRYGVSVDAIRRLNGLSGQDAIHPGQKLKVKE
jgi:LysM repeat protein